MGQTSYFKQKRSVRGSNGCVTQRFLDQQLVILSDPYKISLIVVVLLWQDCVAFSENMYLHRGRQLKKVFIRTLEINQF